MQYNRDEEAVWKKGTGLVEKERRKKGKKKANGCFFLFLSLHPLHYIWVIIKKKQIYLSLFSKAFHFFSLALQFLKS